MALDLQDATALLLQGGAELLLQSEAAETGADAFAWILTGDPLAVTITGDPLAVTLTGDPE